jgi:hypothetical protein
MANDSSRYYWSLTPDIGTDYEVIKEGLKHLSIHSKVYTNISHVLVLPIPDPSIRIYSLIAVDISHPITVVHHVIKESP